MQLREQAGLIASPFSLDDLEETARLIDSASNSHQNTMDPPAKPYYHGFKKNNPNKRFHSSNSSDPAAKPTGSLHCDNHPNATNHSTEDCRSKRLKQTSETPSKDLKQQPAQSNSSKQFITDKRPYIKTEKPRLGPQDENWICIKCKKKAPGHYPRDCPQK
jgi:hypothetical protein